MSGYKCDKLHIIQRKYNDQNYTADEILKKIATCEICSSSVSEKYQEHILYCKSCYNRYLDFDRAMLDSFEFEMGVQWMKFNKEEDVDFYKYDKCIFNENLICSQFLSSEKHCLWCKENPEYRYGVFMD